MSSQNSAKKHFVVALATVFLCITYIIFGYAMCALPPFTTQHIAELTTEDTDSGITKAAHIEVAQAIHSYSFIEADENKLYDAVIRANQKSNTPYADYTIDEIKTAPDKYTITAEQLSHLNDVYDLAITAFTPILGISAMSAFLLMIALRMFGMRSLRSILKYAGIATLMIIFLIGIFACISFKDLFGIFHGILFTQGNWTFNADSLLISSLPTNFWLLMLLFWLCASALIALLSIILSVYLKRKTAIN